MANKPVRFYSDSELCASDPAIGLQANQPVDPLMGKISVKPVGWLVDYLPTNLIYKYVYELIHLHPLRRDKTSYDV